MKKANTLRLAFTTSVLALAVAACSDTSISSPGAPAVPPPPPPPTSPPPPPPSSSSIQLIPSAGCPTGTSEITLPAIASEGLASVDVCAIGDAAGTNTTITQDVTIPAGVAVAIRGAVFIGEDGGTSATLTINQGARLFGAAVDGTGDGSDDYIVINRGSQIDVNGTATGVVRMTARAAINDEEVGSSLISNSTNAQWGGLIINGSAPINACIDSTATGGTASCEKSGEGASGLFGGADAADDSGEINYLSVEFAGARLTNEDELNGIAFQGVGSGTEVSHVQVHNNLDDGIEWFGGTVNARYVVVTGAGDDSLDWTDGWQGNLQYAVVYSDVPSSGDPRGIEADNRDGDNDKTPFSSPNLANFTLIGTSGNQQGILLRRGTRGNIVNGIVSGGYTPGLDIDSGQTYTNLNDGTLTVASLFIDAAQTLATDSDDGPLPAYAAANNIVGGENSLQNRFFPGTQELNVPASNALDGNSFFDDVNYVGAFSSSDTVANNWASFAQTGTLFAPVGCPTGTTENGTLDGKTLCLVPGGNLTSNLTLSNGDQLIYELDGVVGVGVDLGPDPASPVPGGVSATLTIEPGVTVVGADADAYLIVRRGSRLVTNGTANAPVVFTARSAVENPSSIEASTKGIWGGIVINGRAPINACIDAGATGGTVSCEKSGEGASGLFGGATSDDDSGRLRYTRVQYAGTRLTNEDELNGIAFQGVGSGTEVSYVQVANNLDDGIEWFGGTVSADHVVVTGVGDDSLDWTDGWTGSLQYAIAYPGVSPDMSGDPRGIEADNRDGDNDKTPISAPNLSNFTLINSGDSATQQGVLLRRGTRGVIANGIIADWSVGLDVDSDQTYTNFGDGTLQIKSLFLDNTENFATDGDRPGGSGEGTPAFAGGDNIVTGTNSLSGFTFVPNATGVVPGSAELGVTPFAVGGIGNLQTTTHIGAVANANDTWFRGWTVDITGAETTN
ncbi:MAG TPA: hypothetical protein EYG02_14105 [Henriciella marina]|uniref:beta strand repeat-containing protein n=1 Tax=Henriciella sp. TaxID=1968823 RepID=UPI0018167BA0|nr:hypothetical protein [Henriciella sp.]HIG23442.1 hypothetical protein [Henriciella sp.]HIK66142.1 hypothetical protein [Henriciella marina]